MSGISLSRSMTDPISNLFIPASASNIEFASQYDLREMVLTISGGQTFDIRNLYTEFNLYEDMLGTCLSGNMTIFDTMNLLGNAALSGNEKLRIVVDTPTKNSPIDIEFAIYNVGPIMHDTNQTSVRGQTYILNFCSIEKIADAAVIVQKSYQNTTISTMVADILVSYLNTQKKINIEQTSSPQSIIVPGFRPLRTIDWLSTRAVNEKQNPSYVFFENRWGYNFTTIETLSSQAPATVPTYILTPQGADNQNGVPDISRRMQAVKDYQFIGTPDSLNQTRQGVFGSTLATYDPVRMKYSEIPYNILSGVEDFTSVNPNGLPPYFPQSGMAQFPTANRRFYPTDYNRSQTPYGQSHDPSLPNSNAELFMGKRQSLLGAAETFKVRLLVNGDVGLCAGTVIQLNYPALDRRTATDVNNLDPVYSGRYMITAVRHKFGIKSHMSIIEAVKGTVSGGIGRV